MTSTRQLSVGLSLTLLLALTGGTASGKDEGALQSPANISPSALNTPFTSVVIPFQNLALDDSAEQHPTAINEREMKQEKAREVRSDRNMRKFYLKLLLMGGAAP